MRTINDGFAIICLAVIVFSCTACVNVSQSPQETVRARAGQWLDALMRFDIDAIHSFTSPAYQTAHSALFYSKNYAGRNMWKSAALGDIRCDSDDEFGVCKVDLVVTYRGFNMHRDMTTVLTETWLKLDGVWYTQPRQ